MKIYYKIKFFVISIISFCFLVLHCTESLPLRIVPEDTLIITDISVVTSSDPGGYPLLSMTIIGENIYEKTFQNRVNLSGYVHVWRGRDPGVERYIEIRNSKFMLPTKITGNTLTVDPGDNFYIKLEWNLMLADNTWLVDLLDFPPPNPAALWINSTPETFYIEAEITLFSETGLIQFNPKPFELIAWKPNDSTSE